MSSVALARKYRPQTFADLIGQEPIVRTLQNAIRSDRIHHAYIFTGTRGVGKTTSARIFAKALNCEQGPTPDPCGTCDNCRGIAAGNNVDVLEIDAASHTRVEETRELMARVNYAPATGRYRVFIIDEAHMLSKSSFNALLKTLEEPPAHVVFILATTEPQKILETVRSRCLEFAFRRIPAARIAENLRDVLQREGLAFDDVAIDRISLEADGSMRDALSLTDQVAGFAGGELTVAAVEEALGLTGRDAVAQLWISILRRDAQALHQQLGAIWRGGADLRRLAIDMADLLRELLVLRATRQAGEGVLADVLEVSQVWSMTDLYRMFDRLHDGLLTLERSPIPDVVLETTLLGLAVLEPLAPLEQLLSGSSAAPPAATSESAQRPGSAPATSPARRAAAAPREPEPAQPEAPEPARPASGALPGSADVAAYLLQHHPMLMPVLEQGVEIADQTVVLRVPAGNPVLEKLVASEQDALRVSLERLGFDHPQIRAETVAAERLEHERGGPTAPRPVAASGSEPGSKRALLEDERLNAVLKAFPGARVTDVRRLE
ncbi:MAG: DNA polymerase III subunit gamma/tau [Candidatus Dadabacteria bacterium]|nr:MAG: DNA polymerase III subunit gamma/tau [Candidatus Dadabacteria bacterium]